MLEALSHAVVRCGVGFDVERIPCARSLLAAGSGEVDGEGLRVAGLGATCVKLIQVPEPEVRIRCVVRDSKSIAIEPNRGVDRPEPRRVACIAGWKMFEANAAGARSVIEVNLPGSSFACSTPTGSIGLSVRPAHPAHAAEVVRRRR